MPLTNPSTAMRARICRLLIRISAFGSMADFEGVMSEVCAFVGHEPDEALRAEIARTAEKQRRYGSPHEYDLDRFGLDAERIRKDCHFVYETFLP